ncbi:hypothetical protein LSH36_868g00033 [Paralvinella palmiformis]|uniref:Heparan sulfate glucosamine 3-O-sulfotransferase 5 n=1 Tax=Paralvinella palmiformis TaxID=53620 RepID=A0AAD9MRL9_9ANNE|nr:hypothetical protein LSH36_868g00033 [Paralvinella palmiformis]
MLELLFSRLIGDDDDRGRMRTKYQIIHESHTDVLATCHHAATTTPQSQSQCCPLLTRGRLMTALGISLITTILLLLQCVPVMFRPDLCCREMSPLNRASVVKSSKAPQPDADDADADADAADVDDDFLFVDGEYNERLEGGDRVRYKYTKRRLPQCIIIGVRKGGTRALLEFLDLHPDVQAQKQEMHFFDNDDNYARGIEWYRRKMPWSYGGQVTIEKTPAYFVEDIVPQRIHHMNASIKLLLILRDPIDRVVSDYMQIHTTKLAKGRHHESFDQLVIDPDTGQIDKNYKPIRRSIYHRHMERWLQYFDLSQFHLVSGENLVRDPVAELSKVETFLGLGHHLSRDNFYFNSTKGFYCMKLQWRQKCLSNSKGREHPKISDKTMQMLRDFFRPLNDKLYDMVGINFGWKR